MRSDSWFDPIRTFAAWLGHKMRAWKKGIALLVLMSVPAICIAHQLSVTECAEGGDFIHNAALARDGGMSESRFIDKIHEDILVIQSLPAQLRWFVQDDDDAAFLIAAATSVFRDPKEASAHQMDFVRACLGKTGGNALYQL